MKSKNIILILILMICVVCVGFVVANDASFTKTDNIPNNLVVKDVNLNELENKQVIFQLIILICTLISWIMDQKTLQGLFLYM